MIAWQKLFFWLQIFPLGSALTSGLYPRYSGERYRAVLVLMLGLLCKGLLTLILQVDLFNNIKPLFVNKPLLICINKIDVLQVEDLPEEKQVS